MYGKNSYKFKNKKQIASIQHGFKLVKFVYKILFF